MYHKIDLRKSKSGKVETYFSSGVSGDLLTHFRRKYPSLIDEFRRSPKDRMTIDVKYWWEKGKHKMLLKYDGNEPEGF